MKRTTKPSPPECRFCEHITMTEQIEQKDPEPYCTKSNMVLPYKNDWTVTPNGRPTKRVKSIPEWCLFKSKTLNR